MDLNFLELKGEFSVSSLYLRKDVSKKILICSCVLVLHLSYFLLFTQQCLSAAKQSQSRPYTSQSINVRLCTLGKDIQLLILYTPLFSVSGEYQQTEKGSFSNSAPRIGGGSSRQSLF